MSTDPNKPRKLHALVPFPLHMPPDWNPPAPAWSASFAQQMTPVVMAYFGTQFGASDCEERVPLTQKFLASKDAPDNVESAWYIDRSGRCNLISSAYWTDPAKYDRWKDSSGFEKWWSDRARLRDPHGYYREILTVPPSRFETIFSYACQVGVAKTGGCPVVGPIREHNYWGSMRDRIEVSAEGDLLSHHGESLPQLGSAVTAGRRLRVKVPENLAVIRSGQDWTDCAGTELAQYNDSVRPALVEGMAYLRNHPDETGCCDLRFAEETSGDGSPLQRTFGLGYFLTLGHLEKWAATHPTHLAIFSKFLAMVSEHGSDLKLKLWHEVSVLPAADQIFEYVNCHPGTGLLPYFPSEEC
jgi:aldoxime dehydratase